MNLSLTYILSLSIFPGFLYENTGQHGLGSWYALVLVAMYNCGNLIGRYTPLVKWLMFENRKWITIATLSRFLLIPAFYFTAKYGDQGWMIMLVTFLGWTTGHLNVCILIIAPKDYKVIYFFLLNKDYGFVLILLKEIFLFIFVKGPEKNALGNLLVVFVTGGIVVGTSLGWLWLIGKNNAF